MPDTLSLSVSTGLSFGLLAGIVSGVCYLVANGFVWPHTRGEGEAEQERLVREEAVGGGECAECGRRVAVTGLPEDGCACGEPFRAVKFEEGRWFLKQVQKTLSFIPWAISTDKLDTAGTGEGGGGGGWGGGAGAGRTVREFVEQLSARLAGGPLDRTSVASMYQHAAYQGMFARHHAALRDSLAALAGSLRSALTSKPAPHRPARLPCTEGSVTRGIRCTILRELR